MAAAKARKCIDAPAEPELETARLIMPAAEVRRLVYRGVFAEGVAPFVGRMVAALDELRAGRTPKLAARRGGSRPSAELVSAFWLAARQGRTTEAEETAFYAASYAYRNSIDYFLSLLSYLDGFRRVRTSTRRKATRAAAPLKRRR